jgi:hypothetical protein
VSCCNMCVSLVSLFFLVNFKSEVCFWDNQGNIDMYSIAKDVLALVLVYLDVHDIMFSIELVNKTWNTISKQDMIWQGICTYWFPHKQSRSTSNSLGGARAQFKHMIEQHCYVCGEEIEDVCKVLKSKHTTLLCCFSCYHSCAKTPNPQKCTLYFGFDYYTSTNTKPQEEDYAIKIKAEHAQRRYCLTTEEVSQLPHSMDPDTNYTSPCRYLLLKNVQHYAFMKHGGPLGLIQVLQDQDWWYQIRTLVIQAMYCNGIYNCNKILNFVRAYFSKHYRDKSESRAMEYIETHKDQIFQELINDRLIVKAPNNEYHCK